MNRTHHIRMKQNRKALKWFIATCPVDGCPVQSTNVQARLFIPSLLPFATDTTRTACTCPIVQRRETISCG